MAVAPATGASGLQDAVTDADSAYKAGQDALRKNPPDFNAYGQAQTDLADALSRLRALASPPTTPPAASPSPSRSAGPTPRGTAAGSASPGTTPTVAAPGSPPSPAGATASPPQQPRAAPSSG
ncbi:hypothetical protein ND748_14680 [Frankia sp. AiPs1]|uniref:hypothetical protein n=1 Tax=Frankia sp. AiPs1 TaxID=573493 RepID=UPI0020433070|nr:hypothetical protein [Frankia sp. AiPs1]MCM3922902.1 hypothetical protein [Frankia sp. AiPs1]